MGYTCMEIRNDANIKQYIAYIVVEIVFTIFLNFNSQEKYILESFQNGKLF